MEQLRLIALATFVTEDLTCIATGVLVAQGKLDFLPGAMACLLGIYAGDLLLFLGGRFARWPVLRLVPEEKIKHASDWISRRGLIVVFLSRFAPGLRLPTYVAAGLLKTPFRRFALYFLAAAAIWTPLLVGAAALLGAQIPRAAFAPASAVALALAALLRFRVRRRIVGFIRRKIRWEFWPAWAAYIPVIPYLLYRSLKHRSLTLFTVVNPGMPSSGFAGESKSQILEHLSASGAVARYALIPGSIEAYARIERAAEFLAPRGFPVVLKPDVGERGSGVAIVRSRGELESYLRAARGDTIIQEYIDGHEFGVFYYRDPREPQGRIFSITEKRFPRVVGDGESTIEELILRDPRAVSLASVYLRSSKRPPGYVPAASESTPLVELGSHCRGAVFLDATALKTHALEQAIDAISKCHHGFFFGRFDIRVPSVEALQAGREIKVIELNGVSAEATHIYDPAVSLLEAYGALYSQWRIAFEIGSINRRRGAQPMSMPALLALIREHVRPAPIGVDRPAEHARTVDAGIAQ